MNEFPYYDAKTTRIRRRINVPAKGMGGFSANEPTFALVIVLSGPERREDILGTKIKTNFDRQRPGSIKFVGVVP